MAVQLLRPSDGLWFLLLGVLLAALPVEFELRGPPATPVYWRIAAAAAGMQDLGVRVAVIAWYFAFDHHTVEKAIRWFRER